jgi:hypothetical protein
MRWFGWLVGRLIGWLVGWLAGRFQYRSLLDDERCRAWGLDPDKHICIRVEFDSYYTSSSLNPTIGLVVQSSAHLTGSSSSGSAGIASAGESGDASAGAGAGVGVGAGAGVSKSQRPWSREQYDHPKLAMKELEQVVDEAGGRAGSGRGRRWSR